MGVPIVHLAQNPLDPAQINFRAPRKIPRPLDSVRI
jgi:hypothetical protein